VQRLTLVVAIEDHFSLAFAPEDDEAVRSLDDVVALVARGLAPAEAPPVA
jgi:acyl carrier protein